MTTVGREQVKDAATQETAVLVEVLEQDRFTEFHLPGAINVPLDDDFDRRIVAAVPNKRENVIVYCQNRECPASAKAAERMESLGYQNVSDYEAGKTDWKQAGLPIEI